MQWSSTRSRWYISVMLSRLLDCCEPALSQPVSSLMNHTDHDCFCFSLSLCHFGVIRRLAAPPYTSRTNNARTSYYGHVGVFSTLNCSAVRCAGTSSPTSYTSSKSVSPNTNYARILHPITIWSTFENHPKLVSDKYIRSLYPAVICSIPETLHNHGSISTSSARIVDGIPIWTTILLF